MKTSLASSPFDVGQDQDQQGRWFVDTEKDPGLHGFTSASKNGPVNEAAAKQWLRTYRLPPRGSGHNKTVPAFIREGRKRNFDRETLLQRFREIYEPNPGESLEMVFGHAWESVSKNPALRRSAKWPELDRALQGKILREQCRITLATLKSPDGVDTLAETILGRIFRSDEFVCMAEAKNRARTAPMGKHSKFDMPLFVPSPMTAEEGINQNGVESPRCLNNTGARRMLVIEFDGLKDADDQIRVHTHLATIAPLVFITHSGGKSYHGGYWCEGQSEDELRTFMEYAVRLGADRATSTRCQLVRIPNGTALDKEGQPRQRVCFLDLGKIGAGEWHFDRIPSPGDSRLFPLQCLPPVAESMVREMARVTTAQNEALAAAAILGTLSASLGAGLEVPTGGGRTVRGNLFILAIAESGTGKGENFDHATESFREIETASIQHWETAIKPGIMSELAIAEKRAKKFCELAGKAGVGTDLEEITRTHAAETLRIADLGRKLESCPRFRVGDVTKEALAVAMQGQPGQAIASLSSEARGIFSIVKGRYAKEGGDEDFYCSAYSGDTVTVDRLGRPRVTLRRPCLSILWMVQPDAARRAFADASLMESGMLPRFLIFDPKAEPQERFGHLAPIPLEVRTSWNDCVKALLESYRSNGDDPRTVEVTTKTIDAFGDFERETVRRRKRAGDMADFAAFVARWNENAWRLALVLHAARHGGKAHLKKLNSHTARNAIEIVQWFATQQLEVLRWGRQEKLKNRLSTLLAILANGSGEISFRDLRRSHSFPEEEIRELHSLHPEAFTIEKKKQERGRSSMVAKLLENNE